jgi:hypothetical protein
MPIQHNFQTVPVTDRRTGTSLRLFYREAGPKDAPSVLLLLQRLRRNMPTYPTVT